MKIKNTFILLFGFVITIMIIIAFVIALLLENQYKLIESEKIRHKSFIIADELRQSSDDLTNYCRLYVMTGDTVWERKYWKVLQVRNGKSPRPDGQLISLRDSMQKLGFTQYEFDLLKYSEDNSNELVWTEEVAFNSFKGVFADNLGVFQNPTNVVNNYNKHAVTGDTIPEKSIVFQKSVINPMLPEKVSFVPFLYPLTFPANLFLVLILLVIP